jgi:hypothetical protein
MIALKWQRITVICLMSFLCTIGISNAATYFTRTSTAWNVASTWSTVGFGGGAAGAFPIAGDIVNIGNGYNVTVTGAAAAATTLNINAGGTLTLTGVGITISGVTTVNGTVVTLTSGAGTKTFTGQVIINAGGVWNLSGQNPATSFGGGITMSGTTFNNGTGATAFSATQSLAGANNMTFGGTMTPAGGTTLTNNNTGTVTANGTIALTGNFTQGAGSILVPGNNTAFSGAGTLNANTNANTVNYAAAAQTVRPVAYRTLILSGSGIKTMTSVTTIGGNFTLSGTAQATAVAALTVGGNVTLSAGTTFTAGAFTHNVAGDWLNNGGTFTNTNSRINFNGTTQSIGGTNSTTFNNLTLSGSGTKTLTLATFVGAIFNIADGAVANLNGLTTHTANRINFGGRGQSSGTWGGTGSTATNISTVYFAAGAGRITVAVSTTAGLPYIETFTGEADGIVTNATPPWNVTQVPSSGTFEKETPLILLDDDGFEIDDTGATEGVWQTADLDIAAGFTDVYISLDITALFTNAATDYVRVYYVWDGAPASSEVLFGTVTENPGSPSINLPRAGHTKIRLVVRAKDNTGGSIFGVPLSFAFDNVNIIGIRTLYSRANTAWSASGTWSIAGIGGANCTCTPSAQGYDKIFVGGGNTVPLTANAAASSLTVFGTADAGGAGTLNLSTFSLTLGLGGNVVVNAGGTISSSAGSALIFSDAQSHSITDNGSITVGAFSVNNTSWASGLTVTITGTGTFSVTGNVTESTAILGTVTVATSTPMTIGGVVDLSSFFTSFTNNTTVTMTSTAADAITGLGAWTQAPNSRLNFAGANMDVLTFTATAAGNIVDYNRAGAQAINGTTYYHLILSNSGVKTSEDDMTLRGNWSRTGTATFAHGGDEVTFNAQAASAAQTISAVGGETFNNLTFDSDFANAPQITLNNNVTVAAVLTMSSGVVNLNSNNLSLTSTAGGALSHSLSSAAGWVYGGTMTRAFPATAIAMANVAGFVPMGTATNFRPFFFSKTNVGASNGTIALTHTDPGTATGGLSIADATAPAATIITRHNAFWGSTLTGGGTAVFGIRHGGTGLGTVTALAHIRSMLLNAVVASNVTATTASLTDPRAERSGLNSAQMTNNFYVGSTNASSALPITLVSFKGVAQSYGVDLQWKTKSEINNDYFTVLHSTGSTEFKSIGTVKGNGTTTEEKNYSLTDYKPGIGKNYYMLRQTDFDGGTSSHGVITVEVFTLGGAVVIIHPNPVSKGKVLNVEIKGLQPLAPTEFQIVDMRGMTLRSASVVADETGALNTSIDLANGSPGFYVLKVPNGYVKFVVE